jgi:hypothetical protein
MFGNFLVPTNLNTSNQSFNMKKILLAALLVFAVISPALAAYPAGYTPIINYTGSYVIPSDVVHYNISYSHEDAGTTAFPFWLFIAITGIVLLLGSFVLDAKKGGELLAVLAPFPLLVAAIQSLKIDIVTGFGVTSQIAYYGSEGGVQTAAVPSVGEYVLLEHHIIYGEILLAVFFVILFIGSIFNIYRLYVNAKTLKEEYRPMERV